MFTHSNEIIVSIDSGKWYLRRRVNKTIEVYNEGGDLRPLSDVFSSQGAIALFELEAATTTDEVLEAIKRNTLRSFDEPKVHVIRRT